MNKDQIKGRAKELSGKVKGVAGKAVGNDRLRVKGAAQKTAGKIQGSYGDARDALDNEGKKAKRR